MTGVEIRRVSAVVKLFYTLLIDLLWRDFSREKPLGAKSLSQLYQKNIVSTETDHIPGMSFGI
jgi:hypothetical protein